VDPDAVNDPFAQPIAPPEVEDDGEDTGAELAMADVGALDMAEDIALDMPDGALDIALDMPDGELDIALDMPDGELDIALDMPEGALDIADDPPPAAPTELAADVELAAGVEPAGLELLFEPQAANASRLAASIVTVPARRIRPTVHHPSSYRRSRAPTAATSVLRDDPRGPNGAEPGREMNGS